MNTSLNAKLLLVDDHPLVLDALARLIRTEFPNATVVEAPNLTKAREAIEQEISFDLILYDLRLPDAHGLEGLLQLKTRYPEVGVVIVSAYAHPDLIRRAKQLGAEGFIPKSLGREDLSQAIIDILDGTTARRENSVRQREIASYGSSDDKCRSDIGEPLTPQQLKVLLHVCQGMLNKQIAHELGVGETTIKAHMREVLRKLNVSSRTQAMLAITKLDRTQSLPARH